MFVFDKYSTQAEGVAEQLMPYLCVIERLMCEVEFLGGVVLEEGAFDCVYCGSINHWLTTRLLISRISLLFSC